MPRTCLLLAAAAAGVLLTGSALSAPGRGVLVVEGHVESAGLAGSWRSVSDVRNGRFAVRSDLGAYRLGEVWDGIRLWRLDSSGGSHPLDSPFALRVARSDAWLGRLGWLEPGSGGAARSRPSMTTSAGRSYRVVTAMPRDGVPIVLWYDAADGTLARAERPTWFRSRVTTYGDYRDVDGRRLPFAITNDEGGEEERIAVSAYRSAAEAGRDSFAAPAPPADAVVAASGTTVPIEVFPQLGVEATVNGRRMAFIFDTGGHSILTPEAADLLGLRMVGEQRTGGSGAGTLLQRETRVDEVRIGTAVLRDQHFAVLSLPYASVERGARPPFAGLLGLEVLERFVVRLDYRRGALTMLPRNAATTCRSGWRAIRFTDDMPTIQAALDGRSAPFTIDTGNNGSLQLYRHWLESRGLGHRYDRGVETLSYGAGGASRNWVSYASSFRISGEPIRYPMVRTTDDRGGVALSVTEAGNLGTSLLANYTITFDYARSRACFDYVPGLRPFPFSRSGLRAIKEAPDHFLVTLVNEGSPAWQAGLRAGDRITAIDGVDAHDLGGGDLSEAMTQPIGTRVMVRYQRGSSGTTVPVVLRELLAPNRSA